MQTLCNYLLVANQSTEEGFQETQRLTVATIDEWLSEKGVTNPRDKTGTFTSVTPGESGSFSRSELKSEDAGLIEVRLEELSKGGQIFTTSVSVVTTGTKVAVYVAQMVHNVTNIIAPIVTDARCPRLVRRLLELELNWEFAGERLPSPVPVVVTDESDALKLANDITSTTRALPIIVVSENEGEPVWPRIAEQLAYDLAGLARVVIIGDTATWSLTERLGKRNSCYMGAIRLYWPNNTRTEGEVQFRSTVWTASALLSHDHDGKGALRFRSTVRKIVMSVAALAVEPPQEIKQVHSHVSRRQLRELEEKATANSEELKMARLFLDDNEQLRAQVEELQREVRNWSSRAQAAEYALNHNTQVQGDDVTDIPSGIDDEASPEAGDVRFYKKTHSTSSYDVFVRVTDCGHSSWQDASKAEKAKKGLARLLGNQDWRTLHHCGKCTGGGLWRIRW
ncbi:MAG TPA: hypothetical protein VD837_01865 [Terriglobales bacterium]|nr:hypothetical protein [Terriglobales bacterium]